MKQTWILFVMIILCGCNSFDRSASQERAKLQVAYGYQPIDPLPVIVDPVIPEFNDLKKTVKDRNKMILDFLPDESVTIAIGTYDQTGKLTYGTANASKAGRVYEVVLDYIKYNTTRIPVLSELSLLERDKAWRERGGEIGAKSTIESGFKRYKIVDPEDAEFAIPVYVGVGLRLRARVITNEDSVDLGGLIALGIAAKEKKISGNLSIQTLGISGENVTDLVVMPSEISEASIQNAIRSIASIKAKLYDPQTRLEPRVVAIKSGAGRGLERIDGIIGALLVSPVSFPSVLKGRPSVSELEMLVDEFLGLPSKSVLAGRLDEHKRVMAEWEILGVQFKLSEELDKISDRKIIDSMGLVGLVRIYNSLDVLLSSSRLKDGIRKQTPLYVDMSNRIKKCREMYWEQIKNVIADKDKKMNNRSRE